MRTKTMAVAGFIIGPHDAEMECECGAAIHVSWWIEWGQPDTHDTPGTPDIVDGVLTGGCEHHTLESLCDLIADRHLHT